jgi:hypothetical protein
MGRSFGRSRFGRQSNRRIASDVFDSKARKLKLKDFLNESNHIFPSNKKKSKWRTDFGK